MAGSILNFSSTKSTFSLSQKISEATEPSSSLASRSACPSCTKHLAFDKGPFQGVAPEMVNQWEKPTKNFHVGKAIGSTIRNDNGGYNPFKYGWFRNVLLTYSTLMRLYWG